MIYSVTGKLIAVEPGFAVVEAAGVGYRCSTTTSTLAKLPPRGKEVTLLTHLYLREDLLELFGFYTEEELRCFRLLIGVSGVGPKAALAILSSSAPTDLAMSIITGDEKTLTRAPGVGKRIAQRVILELKDKLAKGQTVSGSGESVAMDAVTIIPQNKLSEASAALAVLGYSQAEINMALKGVDIDGQPLEQIIRLALKNMVK